ncbi:MAG TPA: hypothetical protein VF283_14555 [Bryobacteraceae bacterium]
MNLEEARRLLDRAEASLRDAAGDLIQFPLEPARACSALERAERAVTAVRRDWQPANRELADACRRLVREAARISRLLDSAAVFSCQSFAVRAGGSNSYTPAGELQAAAQAEHLVFQG